MKNKYCDAENPKYCEVADFFTITFSTFIKLGMEEKEARNCAYDAVELRFGIGRERAKAIVIEIRRSSTDVSSMRPAFIADNKRLIELLNLVNNEYTRNR